MKIKRLSAITRNISLVIAGTILFTSMSTSAQAELPGITKVASSGTGVSVKTTVLNAVGLDVELAKAQGTGPGPYSATTTSPAYSQVLGLGTSVNVAGIVNLGSLGLSLAASPNAGTCAICSSASSAFNGPGTGTSAANTGYSEVNNLAVALQGTTTVNVPIVGPVSTTLNLVRLAADTVTSTTTFNGTNFVHSSNITDLNLTGTLLLPPLSSLLNVSVGAGAAPNTVLLDIPGLIKIVLNEQFETITGTRRLRTTTATTNAIHITLSDLIGGGNVLNGNVIVGQSTASFTQAVPETTTWMMLIIGFGVIGTSLRSRNRVKTLADGEHEGLMPLAA